MADLHGHVALVTGASRGIGRATAIALAQAGANVAINFHSHPEEAEEVAQICRRAGVRVRLAEADVADQAAVERMVAETLDEFGHLSIAVSNAAFSEREPFHIANMQGFRQTIEVTMWGAFYLLRAASRAMVDQGQGGAITVVSSPHAYTPVPSSMAYNMAKAAIDQMAKTAATELLEHRIRVNIVYPGWIDTPGERKFLSDEALQQQAKQLPWKRLGTPEEIARGILFLSEPASDYITGSSLLIDGAISLPWWARSGFHTESEQVE